MDEKIPPSAEVVVKWGDDVLEALDDPTAYHSEIAALPVPIANIICAEILDWQVRNGGFHQYFYNSYGISIEGAIRGFDAMGLAHCASIARAARAKFGKNFPEDRLERIEFVGDTNDEKVSFDAEDAAYYDLDDAEVHSALDAYALMAMAGQMN